MLNAVRAVGALLTLGALAGMVASFLAGGVFGVIGGVILLVVAAFFGYVVYLLKNPEASMERLTARRAHLDAQTGRQVKDPVETNSLEGFAPSEDASTPAPERLREPRNRAERRAAERQSRRQP